MKALKISDFLPDTVGSEEHPLAVDLKNLLTETAQALGADVKSFEISSNGVAVVQFTKEEVIDKVSAEFSQLDGVEVDTMSSLQIQLERNRAHQATIDKKRAAKEANKKASSKAE